MYRSWCGKRGSNPYGKTTRPSNVRVCLFRHSRDNVKYYIPKTKDCQGVFAKKMKCRKNVAQRRELWINFVY